MKYEITGQMTVSCWTVVEAESKEEALKIAKERAESGEVAKSQTLIWMDTIKYTNGSILIMMVLLII